VEIKSPSVETGKSRLVDMRKKGTSKDETEDDLAPSKVKKIDFHKSSLASKIKPIKKASVKVIAKPKLVAKPKKTEQDLIQSNSQNLQNQPSNDIDLGSIAGAAASGLMETSISKPSS